MSGGKWGKWLLFRRKQHIFTWCFSWSLLSSPGQSCRRSVRFVRTYHQCFRRLFPTSGNGVSDFQEFPPFPNWNRHDVMMSFIEFTGVMEESGRFPDPCEMHCPNSKKSEKRCRWKHCPRTNITHLGEPPPVLWNSGDNNSVLKLPTSNSILNLGRRTP